MIVGNSENQVKFSELTLDMFRMLQALEREPEEYQAYSLENSADFTGDQVIVKLLYPAIEGTANFSKKHDPQVFTRAEGVFLLVFFQ